MPSRTLFQEQQVSYEGEKLLGEALLARRQGAALKSQQAAKAKASKLQYSLLKQLLGGGGIGGGLSGGGGIGGGGSGLLGGDYGAGQRAALEEDFTTAQQNALGALESRGLGGSSLVGSTLASTARQKSLASGELEDRLFREQLQFRTAERSPLYGLLSQLLGGLGV